MPPYPTVTTNRYTVTVKIPFGNTHPTRNLSWEHYKAHGKIPSPTLRAMKIDFKDVDEEIFNVYTNEQLNYDITDWIAASGLPLSTADNVFFRNMMTKARSDLKVMRRTQITQVCLPKLMDTVAN